MGYFVKNPKNVDFSSKKLVIAYLLLYIARSLLTGEHLKGTKNP